MTLQLVRFVDTNGKVLVGVRDHLGISIQQLPVATFAELLALTAEQIRWMVQATVENSSIVEMSRLLPPIDGFTEVWASGVTYRRSRTAREEESDHADVYSRVYDAPRPELFFKSAAWRVTGAGEPIGIRSDSRINVPEPELALVCNSIGEIVGVTICDDVSSRSIEGENPLYLPQAKIYSGSCAVGPGIVPIDSLTDIYSLDVSVRVERDGSSVWQGNTSTSAMHRKFEELVEYLFRQMVFPAGVLLSTGTGLVPHIEFNLIPGDQVTVEIEGVGVLSNHVMSADAKIFNWLTPTPTRAFSPQSK